MRSTFLKLFFSFWLTMIFGGAMSFVVVTTFHHFSTELLRDDMVKKMDANMAKLIVLSGQAAAEMYRCKGLEGYRHYIDNLAEETGITLNLIGDGNRAITGTPLAEELSALADGARKDNNLHLSKSPSALMVAQSLEPRDRKSLLVVGSIPFVGPPPRMQSGSPPYPPFFAGFLPPFFGRGELIRAIIMFVLFSGLCYFLARSLTAPLKKLQHITRQIACGDYSARVGTSLGKSNREFTELGQDFDIMVARTEQVIAAQKRLLRDISHELRSPLARLNVALELAKKRCQVEDAGPLNKIGQEAYRLNELIGHLLTLTRLESGPGKYCSAESVNLGELLDEVAADVDFEAADSGRGVETVFSEEINIAGSRELLRRALENVIRNGARFTAEDTRVNITLSSAHGQAIITVTDFGPGVPDTDLPHLFEPFYRVAEARERQSGGAGIGLAIAQQAIKVHGGKITAENGISPQGLIVTIKLPFGERR